MSDAYVCDRCDALGKGDPAARIARKDDGPGAVHTTTTHVDNSRGGNTLNTPGRRQRPFGSAESESVTTTTVDWVDLCPDCAAAFDEWWDVDDVHQEPVTDGGSPGSHLAAADDDLVEAESVSRDGNGEDAREAIRRARQRIQAVMTSDGGEA